MSIRHLLTLVPSIAAIAWVQAAETGPAPADRTHTVTVTATRLEQSPFDQPYAIHHTDRQALDETSARTLIDAMDATPGVHIQHTAPNQASPYIRGLTGEQTLLLFDGVRLNHAMMRGGPNQYAAMIPDQQVEAIDAILGSSSTVTGSDGLTGALDFRLATPGRGMNKAFSPWAKTRLSSAEGGGIAGGVDGAAGNWRWSVDGSHDSYGTVRGGQDAGDHLFGNAAGDRDIPNTAYQQDTLGARVAFDGWRGQTWELAGGRSAQHEAPRPDGYRQNSNVASRLGRYYDPQVFSYLHARHRTAGIGPFAATQTTLWWHRHDETQVREEVSGSGATARYRRRDNADTVKTLGGDLQLTNRIGRSHALTWGGTAYQDAVDSTYARMQSPVGSLDPSVAVVDQTDAGNPGSTTLPDGSRYTGMGIFAQDLWTIAERWDLLGGLRWSRYDWQGDVTTDRAGYAAYGNSTLKDHDQSCTGSLRLGWHPLPVAMAFAGVSQGYRAPNLTNLMGGQGRASSNIQTQGNPDLESERSLTCEIGAKYQDHRDTAGITLFRTALSNLIQTIYQDADGDGVITGADTARSVNAEDGLLYGCELACDWGLPLPLPKGLRLAIVQSTSYVHGTVDVPQADQTAQEQYISRANRFFGKAGLRLDVDGAWYVIAQTRWSDAYDQVAPGDDTDTRHTTFTNVDGSMPGYAVFDVLGGWYSPEKSFAINGGLQNLGNTTYRNVGSGTDGAGLCAVLGASARF